MNDTTLLSQLSLPQQALMFDLDALYACLQTIPDHRDPRGLHYPLATVLMIGVLAKLAGQDSSRAMAHWAKLRTQELSQLFHLKREKMPHYSTWSRVLGHGVEPTEVEQLIGQFFVTAQSDAEREPRQASASTGWQNVAGNHPAGSNARRPSASGPICRTKAWCWLRCVWMRKAMRLPMPQNCCVRWIYVGWL
jgi:hypothetical protein